jgi:dephospho-CoA kinase
VPGLAARIRAAPPRCGGTRLVCLDGPSGSGKTELAGRLAIALGDPPVVHMDDLYPGWDGLERAVTLLHDDIVAPLGAGRAALHRRYDWGRAEYGPVHDMGTPALLVVEGVGAGARTVAAFAVLLVWVDAPAAERHQRAMERDGEAYRPHWERWAEQERTHFERERTRSRADVVVST